MLWFPEFIIYLAIYLALFWSPTLLAVGKFKISQIQGTQVVCITWKDYGTCSDRTNPFTIRVGKNIWRENKPVEFRCLLTSDLCKIFGYTVFPFKTSDTKTFLKHQLYIGLRIKKKSIVFFSHSSSLLKDFIFQVLFIFSQSSYWRENIVGCQWRS